MDAAIDYINGLVGDSTYFMDKDVVVMCDAEFNVPNIVMTGSRVLENNGSVSSTIDVCENCSLEIYNRGVFNVDFNLHNNASVVQVVSSNADLNKIDFNVDYELRVIDARGIKMSDVTNVGALADEILLRDSFVVWDIDGASVPGIKLAGDVGLEFNDIESIVGRTVLCNVAPDAYVYVATNGDINPMFALNTYVENDYVYLRLVRETDYTKIFNSGLGEYINSLRADSSADGFMMAIDNAMSMEHINKIMADSMRIAPINMMKTVGVFNLLDMNNLDYEPGVGVNYIVIGDSDMRGGFVNAKFDFENINVGIRGYINSLNLNDSFDSYSGLMYGGNIYAEYGCDFNFVRGMLGGNITRFDITNVFDGVRGANNPIGYSIYGIMDIGRYLEINDGLSVAPYVGVGTNYMTILRANDSVVDGHLGMDVMYNFEMFGINYDYGIRAMMNSNDEIVIGGRARFVSDIDMMGGHVAIDYIDNDTGHGYKITAAMNFVF